MSEVATRTVVKAGQSRKFLDFRHYKRLIYFFTWREFKVRYKQTAFGVSWALLEPLLFAGVIWLLLTKRAGLGFGFEGVSDLVVLFISLSLWQFFQGTFGSATNSISGNKALIKKIYFPKAILIFSAIGSKTVDFLLQTAAFLLLVIITGSHINLVGIPFLFVGLFLAGLTSFGLGLLLAPLNVKYRDVGIVLPLIIRIMFFTTPIWYPFTIVPEFLRQILLFNPIVSILEICRNVLFTAPGATVDYSLLLYPLATISILLLVAIPLFKKGEGKLADYM